MSDRVGAMAAPTRSLAVIHMARPFALLLGSMVLIGCAASASDPAVPERPTRSLEMAFRPGPCVAGPNVVLAAALVSDRGRNSRYLQPSDGDLRFEQVFDEGSRAPISFRWLTVPGGPAQIPMPELPWNLELSFDRPERGACPIHIEFRPSPQAERIGLGAAWTTIVLQDPPPPPPVHADQSLDGVVH